MDYPWNQWIHTRKAEGPTLSWRISNRVVGVEGDALRLAKPLRMDIRPGWSVSLVMHAGDLT